MNKQGCFVQLVRLDECPPVRWLAEKCLVHLVVTSASLLVAEERTAGSHKWAPSLVINGVMGPL